MTALDNDIKALRAELDNLRKDFGRIAETLEQTARHGRDEVSERARHSAERMRAQASKAARDVWEEIEERPLTGLLSAFVVGLILGFLFSGRR